MRDYKKLIKQLKEVGGTLVVTKEELIKIRNEYDDKFTLETNRLQFADLQQGRGKLNGVKLAWGQWF